MLLLPTNSYCWIKYVKSGNWKAKQGRKGHSCVVACFLWMISQKFAPEIVCVCMNECLRERVVVHSFNLSSFLLLLLLLRFFMKTRTLCVCISFFNFSTNNLRDMNMIVCMLHALVILCIHFYDDCNVMFGKKSSIAPNATHIPQFSLFSFNILSLLQHCLMMKTQRKWQSQDYFVHFFFRSVCTLPMSSR